MRVIHLTAIAVALVGSVLLSSPADARPIPVTGGCYGESTMSLGNVPGPGFGGTDVLMTAPLANCASPLLPGIGGGMLSFTFPSALLYFSPQASGDIAWSNGAHSTVSGNWNADQTSVFAITSGPAAGHHLLVATTDGHNDYHVTSAMLAP